jgi:phosphatidate cytidylyltransferase
LNFFNSEIFSRNKEIIYVIALILGILVLATVIFGTWALLKPENKPRELIARTRSWWAMAVIFISATFIHPAISYFAFGLLSFTALREIASISRHLREEDRPLIIWGYLAIPVQYYFAYTANYSLFLMFIPVFMHIFIPFVLVVRGNTDGIARSMSILPAHLMLTVFAISHLAFLLSLPTLQGFSPGGRGLLLFIVFITEMNDVFQFIWGKTLGRHKILPKVSPNKTWEGFIGGLITTVLMGYLLRFLTPFSAVESLIVSFAVACFGFVGDVVVSAIKRDIGIKDTGNLIPGHGGLLDR